MLSHIKDSSCQESWPNILNAVSAEEEKLPLRQLSLIALQKARFTSAAMTELCTK